MDAGQGTGALRATVTLGIHDPARECLDPNISLGLSNNYMGTWTL